jgi:hypothetical protein
VCSLATSLFAHDDLSRRAGKFRKRMVMPRVG